jgi:hypothetical protein
MIGGTEGERASNDPGRSRVDRDIRHRRGGVADLDTAADARPGCYPCDDIQAAQGVRLPSWRTDQPDADASGAWDALILCRDGTGCRKDGSSY